MAKPRILCRRCLILQKGNDGGVLNSREPVVVINLTGEDGGFSNITLRGVSKGYQPMRPNVEIIDGRMFNPDLRELIVGEAIRSRFADAQVGSTIDFAGNDWLIVGEFSAGGSGFDSELWCDASQMLDAFNRGSSVSTITLKLNQASDFELFKTAFEKDQRLQQFQAQREQDYYGEQSEGLAGFIRALGIFVTIIFSIGAMVGAMITMYAAVANRSTEIGTLRALGFQRRSILVAFLIEALIIAVAGGLIGVALATLLQFFSISALNFQSFSEIAFSFAMTPGTVIASMIFAIFMGVIGGFLPAVRAARLGIIDALRG